MIAAGPMLQRLNHWAAEGFSTGPVALLAGFEWQAIRPRKVHTSTAQAVLALTRDEILTRLPDGSRVPIIGAQRRAHALMAIGWSCNTQPLRGVTSGTRTRIAAGLHRQVAALYNELSMTAGPNLRNRTRAAYAPPLAWDDDDIDDPLAVPQSYLRTGLDEVAERREAVATLTSSGLSAAAIAGRLGVSDRTVVRDRRAS